MPERAYSTLEPSVHTVISNSKASPTPTIPNHDHSQHMYPFQAQPFYRDQIWIASGKSTVWPCLYSQSPFGLLHYILTYNIIRVWNTYSKSIVEVFLCTVLFAFIRLDATIIFASCAPHTHAILSLSLSPVLPEPDSYNITLWRVFMIYHIFFIPAYVQLSRYIAGALCWCKIANFLVPWNSTNSLALGWTRVLFSSLPLCPTEICIMETKGGHVPNAVRIVPHLRIVNVATNEYSFFRSV